MEWHAPRGSKLSGRQFAATTQNPYLLPVAVEPVLRFARTTNGVPGVVSLGYLDVTSRGSNALPLSS